MLAPPLLACSATVGSGGRPEPSESLGSTTQAIEQCAAQAVEGVDVFDGQGTIDWGTVADAGVVFAMMKATQGTYDVQSTFASNWAGAARARLVRGAYHFFDPTEDGALQARFFLATVGSAAAPTAEVRDLPPMLDVECPDGQPDCLRTGSSGAAPSSAIATRMWDWIHAVEAATGRKPMIYTYSSFFGSSGIMPTGLASYPLFLAYPAADPMGDAARNDCFAVPAPWKSAAMWQYSWTGRVSGIAAAVDRDRFLGSVADLEAFAASSSVPATPTATPSASAPGDDAGPHGDEAGTPRTAGCF